MSEFQSSRQARLGLAGLFKNLFGLGAGVAATSFGISPWIAGGLVLSQVVGQTAFERWLADRSDEEVEASLGHFTQQLQQHLVEQLAKQNRIQTGNLIKFFKDLKQDAAERDDQLNHIYSEIKHTRAKQLKLFFAELQQANESQLEEVIEDHQTMIADFFGMLERQQRSSFSEVHRQLELVGGQLDVIQQATTDTHRIANDILNTLKDNPTQGRDLFADETNCPSNLPYNTLTTLFKGRADDLNKLREQLIATGDGSSAVTIAQTVHGLGGVGKTRLAVEYAWKYQDDYSALLFVSAQNSSILCSSLAALSQGSVLNLVDESVVEQQVRINAVLNWFRKANSWLLIIDNADTESMMEEVTKLLPNLTRGHVLITSRYSNWPADVKTLELDKLSLEASIEFLLERTEGKRQPTGSERETAKALAVELDGLAVALEQSGAFISRHRWSFDRYLEHWRERDQKVQTWYDETLMHYPRSVVTTWDTSFEQLSEEARQLASILCWFSPEPIPLFLFEPERGDSVDCEAALLQLADYSLVKMEFEGKYSACTMHRVVQDVTRQTVSTEDWQTKIRVALKFIARKASEDPPPHDVRSWDFWQPLESHLLSLFEMVDDTTDPDLCSELMHALGSFLRNRAQFETAEALYRRSLTVDAINLGAKHPRVASHINGLALLLQETNRDSEAEPLMRQVLEIDRSHFGPHHPRVAIDLGNLGWLLYEADRLSEADVLFREALTICEDKCDSLDPILATALSNLGQLLMRTDKLEEAEIMHRRVLAIDEAKFGLHHPRVATDLNNLGLVLHNLSRLDEAESFFRRALAVSEGILDGMHPGMAKTLSNLSSLLRDKKQFTEAEQLLRRAIVIFEAKYGSEDPRLAAVLNDLAALLQYGDRFEETEALFRRALSIQEKNFGPNDQRVSDALNNLAQFLTSRNQLEEAEPLIRRALAVDEENHGPKHHHVAVRLINLAQVLRASNRLEEAEPLIRRALEIFKSSNGREISNVAIVLNELAGLLQESNRLTEADPLYRESIAIYETMLGEDDPHMAAPLFNLASLCYQTGEIREAEVLLRRILVMLLIFQIKTGHAHAHYDKAFVGYVSVLEEVGRTEAQIKSELKAVRREAEELAGE